MLIIRNHVKISFHRNSSPKGKLRSLSKTPNLLSWQSPLPTWINLNMGKPAKLSGSLFCYWAEPEIAYILSVLLWKTDSSSDFLGKVQFWTSEYWKTKVKIIQYSCFEDILWNKHRSLAHPNIQIWANLVEMFCAAL